VLVEFTFLCAETLAGAMPAKQSSQLCEVGRILMPVLPLTWQTEQTVVAVTFLWAEIAGAVPGVHALQPSEVRRTTIVPVAGVAGVAGVARRVWQDEHAIMAALTPVCTEVLGALPAVHVSQLSLVASALPVNKVDSANADVRRIALNVNFMMTPNLIVA
jgi:hypothetical protein